MNLFFRFIYLLIRRAFRKKSQSIFEPCETDFRVNIMDIDLNFHMNNGRYLSLMDLGRFDLMMKAGVFLDLIKKGYYPVVTSQVIRFKKSLAPFQKFKIVSKIECWDEKDTYIVQTFISDDVVYAEGFVKARFLNRHQKGSIPTKTIFEEAQIEYRDSDLSKRAELQKMIEKELVQGV
ncbi:MAG: acyl-CoA thioesterase [Pseudomonadota bacterium]